MLLWVIWIFLSNLDRFQVFQWSSFCTFTPLRSHRHPGMVMLPWWDALPAFAVWPARKLSRQTLETGRAVQTADFWQCEHTPVLISILNQPSQPATCSILCFVPPSESRQSGSAVQRWQGRRFERGHFGGPYMALHFPNQISKHCDYFWTRIEDLGLGDSTDHFWRRNPCLDGCVEH